jgi:hypothetical protein
MSDAITTLLVQIKGDATGVVAAFKDLATGATTATTQVTVQTKKLNQALADTGKNAEEATGHIRGLTYGVRSLFDQIRFGIGAGGEMAGFYAIDEGIRALLANGMKFGQLASIFTVVGVAASGVAVIWENLTQKQRELKQQTEELRLALERMPDTLDQIQASAQAGIFGQGGADALAKLLTGQTSYKVTIPTGQAERTGRITQAQADAADNADMKAGMKDPVDWDDSMLMSLFIGQRDSTVTVEANLEERAQMVNAQLVKMGVLIEKLNDKDKGTGEFELTPLGKGLVEEQRLQKELEADKLSGVDRERAAAKQKYDEELARIKELEQLSKGNFPGGQTDAQRQLGSGISRMRANALAGYQNTLAQLNQKPTTEQKDLNDELAKGMEVYKQWNEFLSGVNKQIGEMSARAYEADERKREQLEREAQLKRDIARTDIESAMQAIQDNKLMPERQKLPLLAAYRQQLMAVNQAEISDLENLKKQAVTLADQLALEQKIHDLKSQNQKLSDQPTGQQQGSFSTQFGQAFAGQTNKWTGWAKESANAFSSAWTGSTDAVAGGFTRLFEYGAQKGEWFRQMWNGVIGSMISSATKLAVEYVANYLIMGNAATESQEAQTASAAEGTSQRGALNLAETVFHGAMVALRVAAHIAGEVASTAATAAQAVIRAMYHAIVAAIAAMESEASIPLVGVVLGIAAGAAILAAAYGLMGGFAQGGYTGDGHPSQIAGVVHAGEYVIPANRVGASMGLLRAIHTGSLSDFAAPHLRGPVGQASAPAGAGGVSPSTQHVTHIAVYHDKEKMRQDLEQSDAHEKWVADVQGKNAYKYQ